MDPLSRRRIARAGIVLAASVASGASGATYFVPQDFPTIQGAINAAVNGDSIVIMSGVYHERFDTLGKDIRINGVEVNPPTIDGTGLSGPLITISPGSSIPSLSNLTVRDGDGVLGGAMLVGSGTDVIVRDVRFWFNEAAAGGAVIVGTNADVEFRDCDFWQNTADSDGGAIYALTGARVEIRSSVLEANTAGDDGGAVSMFNSDLFVNSGSGPQTRFLSNLAGVSGGAIALEGGAAADLDAAWFSGNDAGANGGAAAVVGSGSELMAALTTFRDGSAGGTGGGVDVRGGALAHLDRCDIIGNAALSGGGYASFEGRIEAKLVVLNNNTATNFGGGAYVASNNARAEGFFYACRFTGNRANYGAAARISSSGAFDQHPEAVALFMDCLVHANQATTPLGSGGIGAFEFSGSGIQTIVEVINTTITGNSGGAVNGINGSGAPRYDIENSIVWGNAGTNVANSTSRTSAQYSIFPETATYVGPGNLNVNPRFVNPGAHDFRLNAGSPAIDAGRNGSIPTDILDLDGDGTTSERTPLDLYGSPRVSDDPLAPDTGSGSGAKVDIGCHEFPRVCAADVGAPYGGGPDFFDITAFVTLYNAHDPAADLAAPFGVLNFFDMAAYIDLYNAGCP